MWFQEYYVALQTPIGTRQGHMTVSVQEHQICGTLDVLKQANPFSGTISETGECSICGELTSLFRSIPYQGTGNVTQEALCLLLRGKKNPLFFRAEQELLLCLKSGRVQHEKILSDDCKQPQKDISLFSLVSSYRRCPFRNGRGQL